MQSSRQLLAILDRLASPERAIFAVADLRSALPEQSRDQLKVLLSRLVKRGDLQRVCRGIYCYPRARPDPLLVLPRTAARLRAGHFLYLSLESVLSEHGIISQQPLDRLTLMTSGRGGLIDCGDWGCIEFTHSKRGPGDCQGELSYDATRQLWLASPQLAWRDLRFVGRNVDLVDQQLLEELSHADL
ncbi:MAG: hypothetical protein EA401_01180 [Planctomycetota bacterium]|nr:MAG: hypothetical protein EA401_01180 [Planctomycetota bacterium]